jgi:hypothetical protein
MVGVLYDVTGTKKGEWDILRGNGAGVPIITKEVFF